MVRRGVRMCVPEIVGLARLGALKAPGHLQAGRRGSAVRAGLSKRPRASARAAALLLQFGRPVPAPYRWRVGTR